MIGLTNEQRVPWVTWMGSLTEFLCEVPEWKRKERHWWLGSDSVLLKTNKEFLEWLNRVPWPSSLSVRTGLLGIDRVSKQRKKSDLTLRVPCSLTSSEWVPWMSSLNEKKRKKERMIRVCEQRRKGSLSVLTSSLSGKKNGWLGCYRVCKRRKSESWVT